MAQNKTKTKPLSKSAKKRTSKIKSKASRERVVGPNTDADKKVKARGRVKALQTKKVKQTARKSKTPKIKFKPGDHVVYPTHGVGSVQGIERETIGGIDLYLVVIIFENERMTLRIPTKKLEASGLRELSSQKVIDDAMMTLKGRARVKRTMWSRRAQEYELKINSGEPGSIAQVVRDLHRNVGQPDQSFSERQIYEMAVERLAGEVAALDGTNLAEAIEKLGQILREE
ncbi:MAG TPA: CarD family transcriptional regulator [Rhodospirillales bacterium]|nr:CarD family transcriptional regulator [Rhodospirillales bacterium]